MFFSRKSDAEKAREQRLKTLERAVKTQQKEAAKAHKQQQKALKKQQKAADKAQKQQLKQQKQAHKKQVKLALQASKRRQKAAKRAQRPLPFKKSTSCFVCGKGFKSAPHQRRHHCRKCRESCCLACVSKQRRLVPHYKTKQKICVVCDVMTQAETGPRDLVEALAGLGRRPGRPSSAPLPATEGVAVSVRRARSGKGWTLPIRPLLRKRSAQRLRKMELDLLLEKQAMQSGRAIELPPQAA